MTALPLTRPATPSAPVTVRRAAPVVAPVRTAPAPARTDRRRGLLRALLAGAGAVAVPGAAREAAIPALPAPVAQALLVRLGHLAPEAVSGRWDRATVDAVARFQAAAGLPVDGVASAPTADRLRVSAR